MVERDVAAGDAAEWAAWVIELACEWLCETDIKEEASDTFAFFDGCE